MEKFAMEFLLSERLALLLFPQLCHHLLSCLCSTIIFTADAEYPLHKAAREGRADVLTALLRTGEYDVNRGSFDLIRPLHEACLHGHLESVQTLLSFGAQINIRNIDGATPLCDACANGNVEIVKLLLARGAIINPPLLLSSPLHEAVLSDKWQVVDLLLAHGATPNTSDCHYGTPLHIAATRGHYECARLLLRAGADVNKSRIHSTALHDAARCHDEEMLLLLLEHGADVYARDNNSRTARDLLPGVGEGIHGARDLLSKWESSPKCLRHYCRMTVKQALGYKGLCHVEELNLPRSLKDYLQFIPEKAVLKEHIDQPPF
ncbi:hypothetical protein BaRGS_00005332 [Batillaria attramentaria]|uniref:SOCS box domain-containing protein n=1 Tax=Batillaria attramentaria TaxID=370345 RepID=A0ABD0LVB6_9CAEN